MKVGDTVAVPLERVKLNGRFSFPSSKLSTAGFSSSRLPSAPSPSAASPLGARLCFEAVPDQHPYVTLRFSHGGEGKAPVEQEVKVLLSSFGAIQFGYTPFAPATVLVEFCRSFSVWGQHVRFLRAELALEHVRTIEDLLSFTGSRRPLYMGRSTPGWLVTPPFNRLYSWNMRRLVNVLSGLARFLFTVSFVYELFRHLPLWMLPVDPSGLLDSIQEGALHLVSSQLGAHPIIASVVLAITFVFWAALVMSFLTTLLATWISAQVIQLTLGLAVVGNVLSMFKSLRYYTRVFFKLVFGVHGFLNKKAKAKQQ